MEVAVGRGAFEVHGLEDKHIPIIFHYDVVGENKRGMSNWHDNIEIIYCMEGAGQSICNSVEYDVVPGDILVVNSNVIHSFRGNNRIGYYCLIVDSGFLEANGLRVNELEFESLVKSDTVRRLYEKLVEEINSEKEYRVTAIRTQVLNLVLHLARHYALSGSERTKGKAAVDDYIKKSISYMKSNYGERLTLDKVAEEVGLSKYYFAREFKRATGMTVVSFLNIIRCRNARGLLLNKKHSVRETAYLCGFENDSYFSKTFKKVMGCLPSEVVREAAGVSEDIKENNKDARIIVT